MCVQTCRSSAKRRCDCTGFLGRCGCKPEKCVKSERIHSDLMRKAAHIGQTSCNFPANCSDSARKSGSMRASMKTTYHHPGFKVTSRELCLKSAKNLYLGHRIFNKIRQIHRFFDIFRQILQILCRNQARSGLALRSRAAVACCRHAPSAQPVWRETPSTSSAFAQENPVPT